jgi:pyrroline-5-carboxylate reductase
MQPDSNHTPRIALIGGGNMAGSIIGGLASSGWPGDRIRVAEPRAGRREELEEDHGVVTFEDNTECIAGADIVAFAVKPQVLRDVVSPLAAPLASAAPLVISIVAGIRSGDILGWIGADLPFVRVMPNTPALVNRGVSGLWANELADDEHRRQAERTMTAVGEVVWVDDESLIDTITGVSGSGPAYFFKIIELMMDTAMDNGLDPDSARTLVVETARGAAALISQSDLSPAELRRQVTSPGGTTEAGVRRMEAGGIDEAVRQGVRAAIRRSAELSDQFGGK